MSSQEGLDCDTLARALTQLGAFSGFFVSIGLGKIFHGQTYSFNRGLKWGLSGTASAAALSYFYTKNFESLCTRAHK